MAGTEQEFQEFVAKNRDLIEKLMLLQKEGAIEVASAGRSAVHEAKDMAEASRQKTEDMAKAVYTMFTDPEVQRHFMAMGMELFMGVSAMMQRAPVPDFVKDVAGSTEKTWKASTCRANEDCSARSKVQKVNINSDSGPSEIKIGDGSETE